MKMLRTVPGTWKAHNQFHLYNHHNSHLTLSTFFSQEETEAQRGKVTCPRLHNQQVTELEVEP